MQTQESVPVDALSVGSLSKMHMQDLFLLDALWQVDKLSENPCSAAEHLKIDRTLEIFTVFDLLL